MTEEEIKKIARKFAELKGGHAVCSETEIQKRALLLEQYTHFLMEDFCIVPKSKVIEKWNEVKTWRFTEYFRGRFQLLKELFGKDTFEEERE